MGGWFRVLRGRRGFLGWVPGFGGCMEEGNSVVTPCGLHSGLRQRGRFLWSWDFWHGLSRAPSRVCAGGDGFVVVLVIHGVVERLFPKSDCETQDGHDAYDNGRASGAGEVRVVGLDGAEFYPPANNHHGDCDCEKPKSHDSSQA